MDNTSQIKGWVGVRDRALYRSGLGPCTGSPCVNRHTHTTENITFPQLRWQAGKITCKDKHKLYQKKSASKKKHSKVEVYDRTRHTMTVHQNLIEHKLQGPRRLDIEELLRVELASERR